MQSVLGTRLPVGGKALSISLLSLDFEGNGRKNLAAFSGSTNSAKGLAASGRPVAQSRSDAVQSYFRRGTEHRWFPIMIERKARAKSCASGRWQFCVR